jgi:hypothetical protein
VLSASAFDAGGGSLHSPGFSLAGSLGQPWAGLGLSEAGSWLAAGLLGSGHGGLAQSMPPETMGSALAVGSSMDGGVGVWAGTSSAAQALAPAAVGEPAFGLSAGDGQVRFTNDLTVTLNLHAPAALEQQLSQALDWRTASWLGAVPTVTWRLIPEPGIVTPTRINGRFRDGEGRVYGTYQASVFYDGTPPSGRVDVLADDGNVVTLGLDASDDNSGVAQVRIGADKAFSGAAWQAMTETLTATWPAEGIVYVQFRDRAGNLSVVMGRGDLPKIFLPVALKQP